MFFLQLRQERDSGEGMISLIPTGIENVCLTWATTVSQESDQSGTCICGGEFQPVSRWCFSTSFRHLSGLKVSGRPPRSQLLPESHVEQHSTMILHYCYTAITYFCVLRTNI